MPRFGFGAHALRLERHLADSLQLTPLPLPPEFTTREGRWKGSGATLMATAWSGPSVAFARFVSLTAPALDIGNILVMPRRDLAAPIFGADLVGARPDAGLVVADLSPVVGGPDGAPAAPLPDWAAGVFSSTPVIERTSPEHVFRALGQVDDMARRFVSLLGETTTPGDGDSILAAHARYIDAHRRDEKTAAMLANIFGGEWAAAFVDRVLYPPPA
jgi:hypothetical protein